MADVVRSLLGRVEGDVTVPGVGRRGDRDGVALLVRHERHPVDDLRDTLEVVVGGHVGDTVLVHDLGATELQVGGVDLTTQELVDGRGTGEDDGLALDLDGTLAEADEVGTDTDGTAGDEGDGENVLVGT